MKFFELKKILSKEEIQHISINLKDVSKSLSLLFTNLAPLSEKTFKKEKAKIYKKVYGKTYTDAKDQYLRNQISTLHDHTSVLISQFWYARQRAYDFPSIQTLLSTLIKRRAVTLFEKEWTYYLQILQQARDYASLKAMYELQLRYRFTQQVSLKNIEEMAAIASEIMRYEVLGNSEGIALAEYYFHFVNDLKRKTNQPLLAVDELTAQIAFQNESHYKELITAYNTFLSTNHLEEKILQVNIILLYHEDAFVNRPTLKRLIPTAIFNLGVALYLNGRFSDAIGYFDTWYSKYYASEELNYQFIFLLTYSTNLMHLHRYQQVLSLYNNLPDTLLKQNDYGLRLRLNKAMCYVFLNQFENARPLVDQAMQDSLEVFVVVYSRIILSIYYYGTSDYESAIREATNLTKSTHYDTPTISDEKAANEFLLKFYRIRLNNSSTVTTELQQLHQSISKYTSDTGKNTLLIKWLLEKCQSKDNLI